MVDLLLLVPHRGHPEENQGLLIFVGKWFVVVGTTWLLRESENPSPTVSQAGIPGSPALGMTAHVSPDAAGDLPGREHSAAAGTSHPDQGDATEGGTD